MRTKKLTVGSLKSGNEERHRTGAYNDTVSAVKQHEDYSANSIKGIVKPEPKTITFTQNNKVYSITASEGNHTLLDAALQSNKPVNFKCRAGTCGKCAVKIIKGEHCLAGKTDQEKETLKKKKIPGFRLACQSVVECN
ncbi:(2Fe-2S)-binding protein [Evansella sp. LMS18]|uniref:2Fe-2S iron-sulfur cluster-binding protein n=1 Tax=Evansella sp. LMS18 TaxID=2924033 RepID=UPI0020D1A9CA|nr:2Fe-2S iron-sulfur cluster-binding protein [Evansella sp. LMS18]UTR11688.1 (2Fe-2S)-binding protein [Evansella sp. LMS18]